MRKRINLSLAGMAAAGILMTMILMLSVFFGVYQDRVKKDLRTSTIVLVNTGLFSKEHAGFIDLGNSELRVTWVDENGDVLYDNDADKGGMTNHASRPEIEEAFAEGSGEAVRRSDTMGMDTYYYAVRLKDGTVLRLASEATSIFSMSRKGLAAFALILLAMELLSVAVAHFLTRKMIEPLDQMARDMGSGQDVEPVYKELVPFANTIREQHTDILKSARMRQDFTANVSHELKTPLTAISGYAELIETGMVPEGEAKTYAAKIHKNANRLLSLIDDTIRLSQLDRPESFMQMEPVQLDELMRQCVENLQFNAQNRGISLSGYATPVTIEGSREQLSELITNLCTNAIRYNNRGGWVHVSVKEEDGRPVLIVEDNGIGIPAQHHERIFERFYRVDKSRSKETGGTGLGLAIVKHIAQLHNAQIELESTPGRGTRVRVRF